MKAAVGGWGTLRVVFSGPSGAGLLSMWCRLGAGNLASVKNDQRETHV